MLVLLLSTDSGTFTGRALAQTLFIANNEGAECVKFDTRSAPLMTWWSASDMCSFGKEVPTPVDFPSVTAEYIRHQFRFYNDGLLNDLTGIGQMTEMPLTAEVSGRLDGRLFEEGFLPLAIINGTVTSFWHARASDTDLQFWKL